MSAARSASYRSASLLQSLAVGFVLLLLFALLTAGVLWYLVYAVDASPPEQAEVPGLQAPTTIQWSDRGPATIEASTLADTYAALGYVHGLRRTWSIVLWRQTALGRLAEWFGAGVLPIDRHARRLDLARQSRQAYARLPDADRTLLDAYAAGVNAAFDADAARHHDELVLLDLAPAPWAPWHTLTIERLFGWLATAPLPDSVASSFTRADAQFRRWLRLEGLPHSIAWTHQSEGSTVLFQRHTYGTSALPLFDDVIIQRPGRPDIAGASLPGTPFLPTGTAGSDGWSLLLDSRTALSRVDTAALTTTSSFHRLQTHTNREDLLHVRRAESGLPLPATSPDSMATILQWDGFRPLSDAPAWRALLQADPPSFQLLSGSGLRIGPDGWRLTGPATIHKPLPDGLLIGRTRWAHYQAEALRPRLRTAASADALALGQSDSSVWATQQGETLLPVIRSMDGETGPVGDALTYLRNWNFRYDRASIAASVLDTWLHQQGAPFAPLASDSLQAEAMDMYQRSLRRAVDTLVARFGADAEQWRWERVQPNQRHFPVWSADDRVNQDLQTLATTRYAPIRRPHGGHPSVPAGGASLLQSTPTPASWAGWMSTDPDQPLMSLRHHLRPEAFMSRYTASDRFPEPVPLVPDPSPEWTTRLVPAEPPQ